VYHGTIHYTKDIALLHCNLKGGRFCTAD